MGIDHRLDGNSQTKALSQSLSARYMTSLPQAIVSNGRDRYWLAYEGRVPSV